MGGSSQAGDSSDAGTGIGAESSPASGSQGAVGPAQSSGGGRQTGQQGQAGRGMGAGGFEAGTGIGAARPAGTVRAASLQVN